MLYIISFQVISDPRHLKTLGSPTQEEADLRFGV